MGYDDIIEALHGDMCHFLEGPDRRKQITMPRSFVKTWIGSIAYPIWVTLERTEEKDFPYYGAWNDKYWQLGPNMRILIASYVISNAEKMISLIRKTYEANSMMQILFPEVIPYNFNKVRWSNQSACIRRTEQATESTFEAAGIGGASTSRHYDLIIEDDLIYAKKDDFSGKELQPNQEDIDKAIGWHKLATSLLVPGKHTHIHNAGTRWAKEDLVAYVWKHEGHYKKFVRACVDIEELKQKGDWQKCEPAWPECYDYTQLKMIYDAQGPYMFATQYLLQPSSPEEMLFKPEWLQFYTSKAELPKRMRIFTTVDLSEWSDTNRKAACEGVILTCGWCDKHHMWILHYDKGRFNPSEVITRMGWHWTVFKPERIGVEAVYYQKALAHFAREYMDEGKVPRMNLREMKPEGNVAKEIRIMGLEPLASNLAIHCKPTHKAWIEEFGEYVPNSRMCKKDLLDAAAYQIQIARPSQPTPLEARKHSGEMEVTVGNMEEFLEWAWTRNTSKDRFGNPGVVAEPFKEPAAVDFLADATDPFSEESW